jgi:hypothetical protein
MVTVHVTDPENLRNVRLDFLEEEEPGSGSAAIEEETAFFSLDKNAGMFASGTGVAVGRAEKYGAHRGDDARFCCGRQRKSWWLSIPGSFVNRLGAVVFDRVEDVAKDLIGPLIGINVGDQLIAVEFEDGLGLFFIDFLASLDHFNIDVIKSVFFQCATLEAIVDLGFIRALEMEDSADVELVAEDLGLIDIAGNSVENEEVDVGLEASGLNHAVNLVRPQTDCNIVGN